MTELQTQTVAKQEKAGYHVVTVMSSGEVRMGKSNGTGTDYIHVDVYGFID